VEVGPSGQRFFKPPPQGEQDVFFMSRSIDNREKRLAELKKQVPTRGLDRYPSFCKDISELPAELQSRTVSALCSRESTQTIIAFPPQIHRGWHYVPKQALLFTPAGVIHLVASIWPDQEPQITYLKGCDLLYMKVTLLLLYGFLEIVGASPGETNRVSMEFNTVAWNYLSQPLRQLLRSTEAGSGAQQEVEISTTSRQARENLPLKFSNGLTIYGLLPGEHLQELVFQPATWQPYLHFFRRPVSSNTLLMLTTNYMVVIQEELQVELGWILSYIPRSNIFEVQSRPCGLWNELSIQLRQGGQPADYKLLLHSEAVEAWRTEWIRHGGAWQDLSAYQA
jgi:hypothetical protein